jgi:hypothetical protein
VHAREQRTLDRLNEPLDEAVRLFVVRRDVDQARAVTTAHRAQRLGVELERVVGMQRLGWAKDTHPLTLVHLEDLGRRLGLHRHGARRAGGAIDDHQRTRVAGVGARHRHHVDVHGGETSLVRKRLEVGRLALRLAGASGRSGNGRTSRRPACMVMPGHQNAFCSSAQSCVVRHGDPVRLCSAPISCGTLRRHGTTTAPRARGTDDDPQAAVGCDRWLATRECCGSSGGSRARAKRTA